MNYNGLLYGSSVADQSANDPLPTLETHPQTKRIYYYWPHLKPLAEAYSDVIRGLRKGEPPPWDIGALLVGKPLQELEKE